MKIKFKNGTRTYTMKVKEELGNGDVILIDGSLIEKHEILETIEDKPIDFSKIKIAKSEDKKGRSSVNAYKLDELGHYNPKDYNK